MTNCLSVQQVLFSAGQQRCKVMALYFLLVDTCIILFS